MIPIATRDLEGVEVVRGPGARIEGLTSDSRNVGAGDLFVAIRGGVDHVADAARRGAAAVLVPREAVESATATDASAVLVADDTVVALGALGAQNRRRSSAIVVAITGSAGKTSTKDLAATMLAPLGHVVAAEHGYNNEIGVALTLSAIEADTAICVAEMGMRGTGQIGLLAELARPDVGVITNVGVAHLELLGSRAAIADAKGELLRALAPGSVAVVPAGEPLLARHLDGLEALTFGEEAGARIRIVERRASADGQRVVLSVGGARHEVEMRSVGAHQARNLAAVTALVVGLGGDPAASLPLAREAVPSRWRDEVHSLPGGGIVVNDAWNANPPAVVAALAGLAERGAGRLVAVLGAMAELGPTADDFHRRVGAHASALGYAVIVAVGEPARGFLEGAGPIAEPYFLPDAEDLAALLADVVRPGDRVLVKGSRSGGLERVAADLVRWLAGRTAEPAPGGGGS